MDYLTCGQCLKEFPLQRITLFIQHKKLDCDEVEDMQMQDPELQCVYCPQGFMTAWGLLVHAQLTHNLKIFLERASQSLMNQNQLKSQSRTPGMVFSGKNSSSQRGDLHEIMDTVPADNPAVHKMERNISPERDKTLKYSENTSPHVQNLVSAVTQNNLSPVQGLQTVSDNNNTSNRSCLSRMGSGIMVTRDMTSGSKQVRERTTAEGNCIRDLFHSTSKNLTSTISVTLPKSDSRSSQESIGGVTIGQMRSEVAENSPQKIMHPISISVTDLLSVSNSSLTQTSTQTTLVPVEGYQQTSTQKLTPTTMVSVVSNPIVSERPSVQIATSETPVLRQQLTSKKVLLTGPNRTKPEGLPTIPSLIKDGPSIPVSGAQSSADDIESNQFASVYLVSANGKLSPGSFVELPSFDSAQMIIDDTCVKSVQTRDNFHKDMPLDIMGDSSQTCSIETRNGEQKQEQDKSSTSNQGSACLEDETMDGTLSACCDIQGCGVTVIPGSHQILQKCCNSVVPKKRKRHMEMKHMPPFSWSSSRYARRKMLQRSLAATATKSLSSAFLSSTSGGTIYIDLEPDSLLIDDKLRNSDSQPGANMEISQSTSSNDSSRSNPVPTETILKGSENRSHSLILQPGAIFSIPFTYNIPTSLPGSRPTLISAAPLSVTGYQKKNQGDVQLGISDLSEDMNFGNTDREVEFRRRKYPTSKPFRCDKCTLAFNQRIHLKKHMSKHTGVKPYKCGECDYSTVERSHLKVHIRIHTGEKPFKCTYCEYATAQNSTLKIHLKRHHGGRMFECNDCDKKFTQEQQLKGHEWEHGTRVISPDKKNNEVDAASAMPETVETRPAMPETLETSNSKKVGIKKDSSTYTVGNTGSAVHDLTNQNDNIGHVISLPEISTNQSIDNDETCALKDTANQNRDLGHVLSIPEEMDQKNVAYFNTLTSKFLTEKCDKI